MTQPCDLSLLEAAEAVRTRVISPVELLDSVLARVDETEPAIHAYVTVDADRAHAAARRAEQDVESGQELGPLHGAPIAVKDIFDVEGIPTRCGSRVRESAAPADRDAVSVALARAAGAVLIGKTVTQEFAAGVVSVPARNPWDPSRIPGGSSGGSGVAVAAGSAIAAFGSDTGGSIRNPASINGVVGLKPTFGTVSTQGVQPLAWSLDTVGPITKSVGDAAAFFDVIALQRPDRTAAALEIGQCISGLRIGVARPHFFDRLQDDVAAAIDTALGVLRSLGAEVMETPWADASLARSSSFVINRVETAAVHRTTIKESADLLADELRLRIESNALYHATGYLRALKGRAIVRESAARVFNDNRLDVIIAPVAAGTAAPADDLNVTYSDGSKESVNLAYTRLTMPFNATGQPSLAVPCGFDRNGLPIGMQIVGRPFQEYRICRIGHAYEQAAGWFRQRPPIVAEER